VIFLRCEKTPPKRLTTESSATVADHSVVRRFLNSQSVQFISPGKTPASGKYCQLLAVLRGPFPHCREFNGTTPNLTAFPSQARPMKDKRQCGRKIASMKGRQGVLAETVRWLSPRRITSNLT
jgi:hypothetical protein